MIGKAHAQQVLQAAEARWRAIPMNSVRLTDAQLTFLSDQRRHLLWRGGNSIGKTFAHALHILHRARGTHPWQPRRHQGPIKLLVAGYSFAQMDPLFEMLWSMCPKDEIDPKVRYVPNNGFRGFKEPTLPFIRGPGAGSYVKFATYEQGAARIMGAQVHYFGMDEPPPEDVWSEAQPRLNAYRGELRVTFTPTPISPPLGYLRKIVEAGRLPELQSSLTVDNVTIRGGLVPYPRMTQAQIDEQLATYLDDERPMREHGAWEVLPSGRWLSAVTDVTVIDRYDVDAAWYVAIGIDHGAGAGRQCATLVLANAAGQVIICDEARVEGVTSIEQDAQAILAMLERNGISWDQVDHWRGDRRHAGDFWGNEKTNRELAREIAHVVGLRTSEAADRGLRIRTPRKYQGSVRFGFRLVNSLAQVGRLRVMRRCEGFRSGARQWCGAPDDPLKDPLDSARYAIEGLYDAQVLRERVAA